MASNKRILKKLGLTLLMTIYIVIPNVSNATLTLSSVPLFTASNAKPNILFILDNSTSMGAAFNDGSGGTTTRIDAAKTALDSVINSLSNVRVGYGTLAPPTKVGGNISDLGGLNLQVPIGDISATKKTACTTAITGTTASCTYSWKSGGTTYTVDDSPLSSALRDAGHYYSNNQSGNFCGGMGGGTPSFNLANGQNNVPAADVLGTRISTGGPVQYACQSNFTVLITDGLDNMAYADPTGNMGINVSYKMTDYDGDCSAAAQTAGGYTCDSFDRKSYDGGTTYPGYDTSSDSTDYAGVLQSSDFLDDIAKTMYDNDLIPNGATATVSGNSEDIGTGKQNMRTFVVGFNDPALSASNARLQDVATQGGGTFSYASDASTLASSIQTATSSILNLIGSAAAVTFNSATLGTNSAIYLALFNSSTWSGDLTSYSLNDTSGAIQGKLWSAATQLDSRSNAVSNRVILTSNGSQGVALRWPADYQNPTTTEMSTSQLQDIMTDEPYSFGTAVAAEKTANDTFGQKVVNYLRGDTTNEGTLFRSRTSRLGDIVHGGPVFVGPPELNWPDGAGSGAGYNGFPTSTNAYSIFKYDKSTDTNPGKADRPGVVYVGSNDGMLHGFATDDNASLGWTAGEEVLAYAPKALFSTSALRGYHYLTESAYNHQFYVDLQPTVSDYYDYSSSSWKTILVGGLRGGGRGLYALDVTNPQNFSEANAASIVMGEFTNSDDVDLGYTFSRPTVALTNVKNAGGNYRWAVIFGNGYNADTGAGATGQAALYILFLDADLSDGTWDLGTDYLKITTGVGSVATPNGLSTPTAIDTTGEGRVDRVYAGDLQGNMWAFDIGGTTTGSWGVATTTNPGAVPVPLFAAGSNHPITTQPEVINNTAAGSGYLVLFGTGQYMASGDNSYTASSPTGDQYFMGVWDDGGHSYTTSDLVAQTITESSGTRTVSNNAVSYSNSVKGWYMQLWNGSNHTGERSVTNPVVRGKYVWFNTTIPSDLTCSYGGDGWQMVVNSLTGANPTTGIFDSNGDGFVNNSDTALSGEAFQEGLPAAPSFLGNHRYTPGTKTQNGSQVENDTVETLTGSGTGRLSWEELIPQ